MSFEDTNIINFEGVDLPPAMGFIDVATLYGYLPDIPEQTSEWFWSFTICKGRRRGDDAETIQAHTSLLLERLLEHRNQLFTALLESGRSPDDARHLIVDWADGLRIILEAVVGKTKCFWSGRSSIA